MRDVDRAYAEEYKRMTEENERRRREMEDKRRERIGKLEIMGNDNAERERALQQVLLQPKEPLRSSQKSPGVVAKRALALQPKAFKNAERERALLQPKEPWSCSHKGPVLAQNSSSGLLKGHCKVPVKALKAPYSRAPAAAGGPVGNPKP